MNTTSVTFYRLTLEFSSHTRRQVDVLAMANSIVMAEKIIANMLVKSILIKPTHVGNNTFKKILMLGVSDLMLKVDSQNLGTAILYESNCILMDTYGFIVVFLIHLSM